MHACVQTQVEIEQDQATRPPSVHSACSSALTPLCLSVAEGRNKGGERGKRITETAMAQNNAQELFDWDEDRPNPGPRCKNNLLSFPDNENFFKSTHKIFPWADCGAHDTARKCVASPFIEAIFRRARVANPLKLKVILFIDKCLSTVNFMHRALRLLIDEGLLTKVNDDGEEELYVFEDLDEFMDKADALILQLIDRPELMIDETSWEWTEGFDANGPQGSADLVHMHALSLEMMTRATQDLRIYSTLNLMAGPRSTQQAMVDPEEVFYSLFKTDGIFLTTIQGYYHPSAGAVPIAAPSFLMKRASDFLLDTEWPTVYQVMFATWQDYAFDLPRRAKWKTANTQEWAALIQDRLATVIRRHLPTMYLVFEDYLEDSATLVREVQSLGDVLLKNEDHSGLTLWNIEKFERKLLTEYGHLVQTECDEGTSTGDIVAKILTRVKASAAAEKGSSASKDDEDEIKGPKPGQLTRALAAESFVRLEAKYTPKIEGGKMSIKEKLNMMKELLTGKTVLPHAAIFAAKGARMSLYVGTSGAEFLALVYSERHNFDLYLGQSIAYDPDLGKVPETLKDFRYDADETLKTRNGKWGTFDGMNGAVLKLRGQELGTVFSKHDASHALHDGDMLAHIAELHARKFESIGYAREVSEEEGMSNRQFMACLKQIQRFAIAATTEERANAFKMLDDFHLEGYTAAGVAFIRKVYGPSPADKYLHAWLEADEAVVVRLRATLKALHETATFRRNTGAIFGSKAKAATVPGFALASGASSGTEGDGKKLTKAEKRAAQKAKAQAKLAKGLGGGSGPGGDKKHTSTKRAGGGAGPQGTGGGVGSLVEKRRVFPYANGDFSIGEHRSPEPRGHHVRTRGTPSSPARHATAHTGRRSMHGELNPSPAQGRAHDVGTRSVHAMHDETRQDICQILARHDKPDHDPHGIVERRAYRWAHDQKTDSDPSGQKRPRAPLIPTLRPEGYSAVQQTRARMTTSPAPLGVGG